jgi:hypothetical protein
MSINLKIKLLKTFIMKLKMLNLGNKLSKKQQQTIKGSAPIGCLGDNRCHAGDVCCDDTHTCLRPWACPNS